MANYTYGTGTPNQFTTGEQRQVLELGSKIHMYNPDVTPLFTIMGRSSTMVTPVPIFEWMEDEWFVRPDCIMEVGSGGEGLVVSAVAGINDTGSMLRLNRLAQQEAFEKGAVYSYTVTGGVSVARSCTAVICVAQGAACGTGASIGGALDPNDRDVAFIASDGTLPIVRHHSAATTVAAAWTQATTAGTIVLKYIGIAGVGSVSGTAGCSLIHKHTSDNDIFPVTNAGNGYAEGAVLGNETRKKVRRLKNCTQIWREPYTITGTQNAAKMYGGPEMARLQARKLARIKSDLEYSLLTNGGATYDDTSENPLRLMGGFGVGKTGADATGLVQSLNADVNTNMQFTEAVGSAGVGDMEELDSICAEIFKDQISGSMRKTAFCSNRWLKKMAALVRSESSTQLIAEMGQGVTAGLRVTTYYAPVGEIEFVTHPILNNTLDAYALVVDFANVDWRPLNGRDIQLRTNVVKDGRDGQTDEWLIEAGCEIRNEQTHAILKLV